MSEDLTKMEHTVLAVLIHGGMSVDDAMELLCAQRRQVRMQRNAALLALGCIALAAAFVIWVVVEF